LEVLNSNSDKEGRKINLTTKLITLSLKKLKRGGRKKSFFEKSFLVKTLNSSGLLFTNKK